jgi:hypothetical protein
MARNFRPPTAAFARKSYTASCAGRPTLDWLIARKTDGREQKPALQNLLRLGLYQIFWLDRIPDHAAVNETVELAKQNGFGAQAGFVNAVLRGYLREADATQKLLGELKISQPALGWSHPEWLVARWQKRWGIEKTASLLEWNNTPPKTFARVNTLKFRRGELHESQTSGIKSGTRITRPSEFKDAGDLLTRWRDENVEYDFVRRDWLEENLVFELKSHPPLIVAGEFSRRLVLHPGPRHAARRVPARTAARRNDFGFLRRARRQNDVHRAVDEQPGPHRRAGCF